MEFYALVCGIMIGMVGILSGQALGFFVYYFAKGQSSRLVEVLNPGSGDDPEPDPEQEGSGIDSGGEDGEKENKDGEKVETAPTEHAVGVPFNPR